jgi:protein phosphatase 1 regulatory subunit 7
MDHLEIVGTSGQKVTRMGSDLSTRYPNLESLVLRSHLIRTMDGLASFKKLEVLELYDNMIDELRDLNNEGEKGTDGAPGKLLRVLDISYNVIRDMGPVEFCPNLQELYIAQNKIKSIKGLRHLKHLRKVDLGANRIRVMEEIELEGLVNLEELWLGKNKIEKIEGLSRLTKLRRLDVQSNRLTKVENLTSQVDTLEELYLAHNGIDIDGAKCETGLALPFTALDTLDLSRNRLVDTTPFAHLASLTELWISGNDIKTFQDIDSLSHLTNLEGIYLEYNPVASEFEYRKKLAELIPSLNQIDANMIGGLGAYGYIGTAVTGGGLEERMRQLQNTVIQKAAQQATPVED